MRLVVPVGGGQELTWARADVGLAYLEDRSLVALQGPAAAGVLKALLPAGTDLDKWAFMTERTGVSVGGIVCNVTRCGYTGEDGFEVRVTGTGG